MSAMVGSRHSLPDRRTFASTRKPRPEGTFANLRNPRFSERGARRSQDEQRKCLYMNDLHRSLGCAVVLVTVCWGTPAQAGTSTQDPLGFFAGMTETLGTTKIMMHKPVRTRSIGQGRIEPDGSLMLIQRVQDEGQPAYVRTWQIRRIVQGRFTGTMSQAIGPVTIQRVGDRFRFNFRMKGDISVEQWLTPMPGGLSASSDTTMRSSVSRLRLRRRSFAKSL